MQAARPRSITPRALTLPRSTTLNIKHPLTLFTKWGSSIYPQTLISTTRPNTTFLPCLFPATKQ
jgi:hypothetical protein